MFSPIVLLIFYDTQAHVYFNFFQYILLNFIYHSAQKLLFSEDYTPHYDFSVTWFRELNIGTLYGGLLYLIEFRYTYFLLEGRVISDGSTTSVTIVVRRKENTQKIFLRGLFFFNKHKKSQTREPKQFLSEKFCSGFLHPEISHLPQLGFNSQTLGLEGRKLPRDHRIR